MAKSIDIPQDIIDNVIAALGDDTHSLKQCSLVSSSFLLPSRKYLFSRITIRSDETCQGIHQLLVQNPVMQSFVKIISLEHMDTTINPEWMNGTSMLAILRLPFCCLESIILRQSAWKYWSWKCEYWDWNCFSSEMKNALSNIVLSSTLKTLSLNGITNVPITLFRHIAHLTTLELHSITPNDFCDENSRPLTRVASMASDTVIDRCVWRYGYEHVRRYEIPSSAYLSVIQRFHRSIDLIFLPFLCRLRFLEIYLDLTCGTRSDFNILSFLMGSLSISLSSPEHLEFNIRFHSYKIFNYFAFYENLRNTWRHLDGITTRSTSSRLQRVDININYAFQDDLVEKPDKNEISKAVLDGLPLLRTKGILFVKAVLGNDVAWTAVS